MILATTTADFRPFFNTTAEMVRAFDGTGFKHLDYSFYKHNYENSPFMGDNWLKDIVASAKEAEKTGIDFVQAHSPGNDYFREAPEIVIKGNIRAIEACGYLGIKKLVVHSGRCDRFIAPHDKQKYLDGVKKFYEALYPAMEKNNVFVLAENYIPGGDKCSFYRGTELAELIDYCNHPLMGVCWDIGHANLTHPDQYDDIIALGKRLKAVHIQDNYGERDDHICPYMGTVDIDGVMRGLIDNGFAERERVFTFEADNITSMHDAWPNGRRCTGEIKAADPTFEVRYKAECLMYEVGKSILSRYDLFEN